jgi:hypothetical protein
MSGAHTARATLVLAALSSTVLGASCGSDSESPGSSSPGGTAGADGSAATGGSSDKAGSGGDSGGGSGGIAGQGGAASDDGAAGMSGSSGSAGASDDAAIDADASTDVRYRVELFEAPDALAVAVPFGMNDAAVIVGYVGPEQWTPTGFPVRVSVSGGVVKLDVPEARYGFAHAVDATGNLVAGEYDWKPHLWSSGTRSPLAVPDGYNSGRALGVTAGGLIVGSWADYDDPLPPNPIGPRPCYWGSTASPAIPLGLLDPDEPTGSAFAVNSKQQIAGALTSSSGYVAVRWDSPSSPPTDLGGVTGSILTEARAINEHGDVAGRSTFADNSSRAFLRRASDAQAAPLPWLSGGNYAEGIGIDDHRRVVGMAASGTTAHAVVWHEGEVIDLNDRLVAPHPRVRYLSSAVAISESGHIAAEAVLDGSLADELRAIVLLVPEGS